MDDLIELKMKEKGLSCTALAAQVGISAAYLSDLLSGHRGQRTWDKWGPKIASILDIPVELIER